MQLMACMCIHGVPVHFSGMPNPGKATLAVECLDVSFPYAYEYLGCKSYPVFTPRTLNCIVAFTQSLLKYSGCELVGPVGCGKASLISELGMLYGRHVYFMHCNQLTSPSVIMSIMEGCSQVTYSMYVYTVYVLYVHVYIHCVCVCVYVCTYVRTYVYTVYLCTYALYVHMSTEYVCMFVYMYCMYIRTYVCTVYVCLYTCTICTYVHTYVYPLFV